MGVYEKVLGLGIVPLFFILLVLLALGFARKQINWFVRQLLRFNFTINGRTVYLFSLIAALNLIGIVVLFIELQEMTEPSELNQKTEYYKVLYRKYRNFVLNFASFVLIFQISFTGHKYKQYEAVRDELEALKKVK